MFKKIWSYITFRKQPDFGEGKSSYVKMMHGINRLSIIMFLIGIIIVIVKIIKK